jgi:GR25 family glycosyltransferase involved in LPS biosynthesis
MKINEFFEEAYYINLKSRVDRFEHITKELKSNNLDNFVKQYEAISANPKTPQNCVIASGTSHRNLIQHAKNSNLKNILILEDDVFFKPSGIEIIEKSLDSLKDKEWDIFYLSANIFDNPLKLVGENLIRIDGCYCIHAYAVNNRAYDRLLKYIPETDPPFDAYITINAFEKYSAYPLAISQYESISDNVGGLISYDKILENVYSRPII